MVRAAKKSPFKAIENKIKKSFRSGKKIFETKQKLSLNLVSSGNGMISKMVKSTVNTVKGLILILKKYN